MVYVTGDMHGDIDKFKSKEFKKLKKDDYLIVCGDFGFVWDGSEKEKKIYKKIGSLKYNVLFIEGTHDNLDIICEYPEQDFMGGKSRKIFGNLMYLERGYVYTIESKNIFVFGGGESEDALDRTKGVNWWEQELPTMSEIELGKKSLSKYRNVIDYIVTHECSGKMREFMNLDVVSPSSNNLHIFFDYVMKECIYKKWFFGKYHIDKVLSSKANPVFDKVLPLK